MIRTPVFADLPALSDFFLERWAAGKLAHLPINEERLAYVLATCIQKNGREAFIRVWDQDGIKGGILGALAPVYLVTDLLEATDIAWIVHPAASPRAGSALLSAFHTWAWGTPGVVRVKHGLVDTMGAVHPAAVRLLERQGFTLTGGIYEKEKTP